MKRIIVSALMGLFAAVAMAGTDVTNQVGAVWVNPNEALYVWVLLPRKAIACNPDCYAVTDSIPTRVEISIPVVWSTGMDTWQISSDQLAYAQPYFRDETRAAFGPYFSRDEQQAGFPGAVKVTGFRPVSSPRAVYQSRGNGTKYGRPYGSITDGDVLARPGFYGAVRDIGNAGGNRVGWRLDFAPQAQDVHMTGFDTVTHAGGDRYMVFRLVNRSAASYWLQYASGTPYEVQWNIQSWTSTKQPLGAAITDGVRVYYDGSNVATTGHNVGTVIKETAPTW